MATVISDVYKGFRLGRLTQDPRFVSQCMEEYLVQNKLSCQIGPEAECFIFDDIIFHNNNGLKDDEAEVISAEQHGIRKYPIRRKGGYDAPPFQNSLLEFRFEVAEILMKIMV
jgi:glutamine synthetase